MPLFTDLQGFVLVGALFATLATGSAALWWFYRTFALPIEVTRGFVTNLAGHNLATIPPSHFIAPINNLVRSLQQIQVNHASHGESRARRRPGVRLSRGGQ